MHDNFFNFENENNALKNELADLKNQFNQADILVNRMRADISNKDQTISRLEAQFFLFFSHINNNKIFFLMKFKI